VTPARLSAVLFGVAATSLPATGPALAQIAPAQAAPPPFSLTLYAERDYRGASVTLYGDNANLGSTGFANRAASAQARGTWRLCQGGGYRDRCETLSGPVPDLSPYGLAGQVGSAQLLSGGAVRSYGEGSYPETPYPQAPYPQAPYPQAAYPQTSYAQAQPPAYPPPGYGYPPATAQPPLQPVAPQPRAGDRDQVRRAKGTAGETAVFFPRPAIAGRPVSAWGPHAADDFCRSQGLGFAIYYDARRWAERPVDAYGRPAAPNSVLGDVLCRSR